GPESIRGNSVIELNQEARNKLRAVRQKSRRAIRAPRLLSTVFYFLLPTFALAHAKGIERRLIDRCRSGESVIGLVSGQRLSGQWPEQSIHLTLVIAHLLQLSLHVRNHTVRRLSTVTHTDRAVVGIMRSRRIL